MHKTSNHKCALYAVFYFCGKRTMLAMMNNLKTLRKAKKLTQERLAELVDTSHATIQRLENGKISLSLDWAERLAPHLGTSPANIMFNVSELALAQKESEHEIKIIEAEFELVPLVGRVEAGVYSEAAQDEEEDWKYYHLPKSMKYPGFKRFCLEVRGNSMNLLYPPGTLVLCINYYELEEGPLDGAVYVVDRTVHGQVESTLKELRLMPDGTAYLWPRSTDPEHQQPIKMNGNVGEEISLRAKVVGGYIEP